MTKRLLSLLLLSVLVSCNFHIEKRKYFKGYYIENSSAKYTPAPKSSKITPHTVAIDTDNKYELVSEKSSALVELATTSLTKTPTTTPIVESTNAFNESPSLTQSTKQHLTQRQFKLQETKSAIFQNKKKKNSDGYLFALSALLGLSMIGFIRSFKQTTFKLSIWAARNKYKTQAIIAVLQTGYAATGIALGKTLHNSGYDFSNTSNYIFSGLFGLGAIALLTQKKSSETNVLKTFFRTKMAHIVIALASIMLMIGIGNKAGQGDPANSPAGYVIENFHTQSIAKEQSDFSTNSRIVSEPKASSPYDGLLIGLYIFLIVLAAAAIVILSCVLLCWTLMSSGNPATFALVAIADAICVIGLVAAIVALTRLFRKLKTEKQQKSQEPKHDTNPTY